MRAAWMHEEAFLFFRTLIARMAGSMWKSGAEAVHKLVLWM
jgi:hypothetical protein